MPTPIDKSNMPNLDYIISATTIVANALKNRSKKNTISRPIIIYESTVYPGATEELCINKLEQISGLVLDDGFSCGYSPERINPGDKDKRIGDIIIRLQKRLQVGQSIMAIYISLRELKPVIL